LGDVPAASSRAFASTRIVTESASSARGSWRRTRNVSTFALAVGFLANLFRLGIVQGEWPLAVGITAVGAAAVPLLVSFGKRKDAKATADAHDALFVAGFNLAVNELKQPRFAQAAKAVGSGAFSSGYVSGRLTLDANAITLRPARREAATIVIPASEVDTIELDRNRVKWNIGVLRIALSDGAHLFVEVRQYDRLRAVLDRVAQAQSV
jgi:hypothetical protein